MNHLPLQVGTPTIARLNARFRLVVSHDTNYWSCASDWEISAHSVLKILRLPSYVPIFQYRYLKIVLTIFVIIHESTVNLAPRYVTLAIREKNAQKLLLL